MKFHILIIFKKSYWNFLCPTGKLSPRKIYIEARLPDRNFRILLVVNPKYAGSVKTGEIV